MSKHVYVASLNMFTINFIVFHDQHGQTADYHSAVQINAPDEDL